MPIPTLLSQARTIAVVGLSPSSWRPSHEVAEYLQDHGYRIIPVNPEIEHVLGQKAYPDLLSVPEPVDIVNVFRRPEYGVAIAQQAVQIGAKAIWFQLGVINQQAADIASEAGLTVVMNLCLKVEHRRHLGGRG